MLLSGMIICQNEESIIQRAILEILDAVDELIIVDGGSNDSTISKIKELSSPKIKAFARNFNGHFGDQKNFGISMCSGQWVLNIDADEQLESCLRDKDYFKTIILDEMMKDKNIGCFKFARVNLINGQQSPIYPDFQARLFRQVCRFIYPVHEELVGFRKAIEIEAEGFRFIHSKTNIQQARQNISYDKILRKFKNIVPTYILSDRQIYMKGDK